MHRSMRMMNLLPIIPGYALLPPLTPCFVAADAYPAAGDNRLQLQPLLHGLAECIALQQLDSHLLFKSATSANRCSLPGYAL